MPQESAQSRELEYSAWIDGQGYLLNTGKSYTYSALRSLLRHPIVSRAAYSIIQAVAAHKWVVRVEGNARAEEWIGLVMSRLGDRMIRKALDSLFFGWQVGELYFPDKVDGLYWPAVAYPPHDYIYLRIDDNWGYAGYKQRQPNGKKAEVDAADSVLWTWGDWGGNPYGLGILESCYAYAKNHSIIMDQITTMAKRQNWPLGVIGVPGDGRASQSSIDDFASDLAALPEKEVPIVAYKQYAQNAITLSVIQPVSGAMTEASAAAMDLVRMIAAAMIVPLRIFLSPSNEGGSYSLVEIQMSEHDRMITGLWNYLMSGINDLIGMMLRVNFGELEYTFDLEYIDEQSLRAARETLNEMLRQGVGLETVDVPALVDMAGLPAVSEEKVSTGSTAAVETRSVKAETQVMALARKVKRELDQYYNSRIDGLVKRVVGLNNPLALISETIRGAIAHARQVYRQYLGPVPIISDKLTADYRRMPKRLTARYLKTLEGITEDLQSLRLRYGDAAVNDKWARKHAEQARRLVDKALKAGYYYIGDLQRGKTVDSNA